MNDCCQAAMYALDRPQECPDCGKPLRGASWFADQLDAAIRTRPSLRDREPSWADRDDDYFEGREVT